MSHKRFYLHIVCLTNRFDELINNEMNSMKLGKLLKFDSNFIVNYIFFSLFRLLLWHSADYLFNNMKNSFHYHISQLKNSPSSLSSKFNTFHLLLSWKIVDTISERCSLSQVSQIAFQNKLSSLQIHNCVLPFMSIISCIFVHELRYPWIVGCSMTSHWSSKDFHSILANLTKKTLGYS